LDSINCVIFLHYLNNYRLLKKGSAPRSFDLEISGSIPGRGRNASLLHSVQTGNGAHPTPLPVEYLGYLRVMEMAEA
jgi:hypothetical protein